jgi:ribose/xylose/arabinose/galactoside ABC-type transport system permease subunit
MSTKSTGEAGKGGWAALSRRPLFWPLAILAALLLFNLPFTPDFFDVSVKEGHLVGSLINIPFFATPVLLIALGMTPVIATGGIDLSVGAVMAISGAVACRIISRAEDQNSILLVLGAIGLALLAAMAAGLFNGVMVGRLGVQPIIATLILLVAGRGVAQLITDGFILTELSRPYGVIGGYALGIPTGVFLIAAFAAGLVFLTRRTALGLLIESVGGNAEAARLAGVRAQRIKILVYVLCGLLAGVAGLWNSSSLGGADANNAGLWIELDAILAVVIGGTSLTGGRFSIGGTVVGALILQTLKTTIFTIGIPAQANMVFEAVVVILICLLQSAEFRARISGAFRRGGGGRTPPLVEAEPPAVPTQTVEAAPWPS